jgi:hypothetical protein
MTVPTEASTIVQGVQPLEAAEPWAMRNSAWIVVMGVTELFAHGTCTRLLDAQTQFLLGFLSTKLLRHLAL